MNNNQMMLSTVLKKYKFFFDNLKNITDSYLVFADLTTHTSLVSPNMVRDFDVPKEIVQDFNRYWIPLIHPQEREAYNQIFQHLLVKQDIYDFRLEHRVRNRKNEYVWLCGRGRIGSKRDGTPLMVVAIMTRMAARDQADEVTGLLNKYRFEHALKMVLRALHITGEYGAVVFLGLDNFKIINETHNRSVGDEFLRRVSRIIENILPPMLTLYKLDGDMFGVIFPGATEQDINTFFGDIQKSLSQPMMIDGRQCFCTMSAGTVFYPQFGKDYLILQKYAEAALDLAKQGNKNRNCIFNKEQYNRWVRSYSLRDSLMESVKNNCRNFELYFQPIIDARSKNIIGAEALLRWFNAKGRMVAPMEVIPILEETKLIIPVGRWIFEEAVRMCRRWRRIVKDFRVSVNLSYDQVKDHGFREFVEQCLARWQVPPEAMVLELTESSIVADWNFVNGEFDYFRNLGICIAMDDFGTGYSSLAMLKNLSCDIVKIDREFVREIENSEFDLRLVKYAVDMCHSKGMRTCIEGVEQESAYTVLVEKAATDYIQGYLFGRPEPINDFEDKFLNTESVSSE